jgi:RNA polymerase sigma-70 factor (ECF subfamily)
MRSISRDQSDHDRREDPSVPNIDPEDAGDARFTTTSWTVVAHAGERESPEARKALAELCQVYWYPLYAFLRRRGYSPHEAEDLTQGFFADLLARDSLKRVDPSKGKFRSFLLASLQHFLSNRRDWDNRIKRGGKFPRLSLNFRDAESCYLLEPAHEATPERLFERRWALSLLDRVLGRLEREVNRDHKGPLFEQLKPTLMGESDAASYAHIGADLGMTEGAVKVAAHRLRKRYRVLLKEEVTRTLADPVDFEQEINELFQALRL